MDCIVKDTRGIEIRKLYQWDRDQVITITMRPKNKFVNLEEVWDEVEVHFWNEKSKKATVVTGELVRNSVTVMIPNNFFEEGFDINIFVYVMKDGVCNTISSATIPVTDRIEKEGE